MRPGMPSTMERPGHLFCKAVLWAGLALGCQASAAERSEPARKQLNDLRARIGDLTTRLGEELKARDRVAERMRDAELAIPEKRKALESILLARREVEKRRIDLTRQLQQTRKNLEQRREELARQLRVSYLIGREERWKLVLNQESPAAAGRMLAYYGYFGRRQMSQIQSIEQDMSKLDEVRRDLASQTDKLDRLDRDSRLELQALMVARGERAAALAALNQSVQAGNQQIARLKQEEDALNGLLANLRRALPDFELGPQRAFAQMQGKLPWPVAGRLSARFHQSRGGTRDNSLRWSGVMIDAPRGAKVRASYYGRVVYADWLQGLGLLLIIEHGAGYMTLYGHAEVLYKSVGDSVSPGDVVAALNETDGTPLYFEIRQGKTPLDPQRWLKSSH